jgi:hypothetical protein
MRPEINRMIASPRYQGFGWNEPMSQPTSEVLEDVFPSVVPGTTAGIRADGRFSPGTNRINGSRQAGPNVQSEYVAPNQAHKIKNLPLGPSPRRTFKASKLFRINTP